MNWGLVGDDGETIEGCVERDTSRVSSTTTEREVMVALGAVREGDDED